MRHLLLFAVVLLACTRSPAADALRFTDVTIQPVTARPSLLLDPADLPAAKERFARQPAAAGLDPARYDQIWIALSAGDHALRQRVTAAFVQDVRRLLTPGADGTYASYRRYNETFYRYDAVASFGLLSPTEDAEIKRVLVDGADHYVGEDPDLAKFGTDNRSLDQALVGGLAGLTFPDVPQAKSWVAFTANLIQKQLDHGVWDGAWNEVPRYHNWTMLLYSGYFHALQRRTGIDFYQHPNTKRLLDWYVRFSSSLVRFPHQITPLTPQGEPTLPVWGDGNYGADFEVLALFAPHYATSDPAFAQRLMWMWRRAGSPLMRGWHFDLIFPQIADPTLPDAPQILGSSLARKPGYAVLRSGFNTPDETAIFLRGGQRGILHPRSDLGSFDLFSQGFPLALGAQSGAYGSPEHEGWHRSQQANNAVVFGGVSRDRREASGTILAFATTPEADYLVTDCSRPASKWVPANASFTWRRHLVLVKQPDYLVIWDEVGGPQPAEWFLHTTAERFTWEPHAVVCHTAFNLDLGVEVLAPATPLTAQVSEGRFGEWAASDPRRRKRDPYPFTMLKYLRVPAKAGESFVTVLHPRRADGTPIHSTLVLNEPQRIALEITLPGRTDRLSMGADGARLQRGAAPEISLPSRIQASEP